MASMIDEDLLVDKPNPLEQLESDDAEKQPPQKWSRTVLVLWLVVIGLAAFVMPLYLIAAAAQDDVKSMNTDLTSLRSSLTTVPTSPPEIRKLLTPLAQVQGQINQVSTVYPTIVAPRIDWSAVMGAVANFNPNTLVLTTVTHTNTIILLEGRASDDGAVAAYARSLEDSNLFSHVVIQSMQSLTAPVTASTTASTPIATIMLKNPTPTPTFVLPTARIYLEPTGAPVPPTPTNTPTLTQTPDLRDPYEPDDAQPKTIALGQPQQHNFYPNNDVDQVIFLAKSGRSYRVYTMGLAAGVDTVLTVSVSGNTLTNDDVKPGALSSEVDFQNNGGDASAFVTIANRGTFGPDKTYTIAVEEFVPLPTSAPVVPTNTPTATWTPMPTATPDLRDPYEPDDVTPRSIAIGETQSHNFYPNGDVDQVSFPAKSGRYYQALTSNLALGVDTVLTISVGNATWTNDDYASGGSGNFASAVCFQAPQDGAAVAKITNPRGQYGADKTYRITVNEVTSLNTAPCLPVTLTPTPAALRLTKAVPGLAKPIEPGSSFQHEDGQSLLQSMTVKFAILVEPKVTAP